MENGKEFLSVRRRYGDNVDCEEFRIHLFLFPLPSNSSVTRF